MEWKLTYRKQVDAVKSYIGTQKGYEYSRDKGIMPYIENIAKTDCGVAVKDRWDPMDIVMVKKSMRKTVEGTIRELTNMEGMSKELVKNKDRMENMINDLDGRKTIQAEKTMPACCFHKGGEGGKIGFDGRNWRRKRCEEKCCKERELNEFKNFLRE